MGYLKEAMGHVREVFGGGEPSKGATAKKWAQSHDPSKPQSLVAGGGLSPERAKRLSKRDAIEAYRAHRKAATKASEKAHAENTPRAHEDAKAAHEKAHFFAEQIGLKKPEHKEAASAHQEKARTVGRSGELGNRRAAATAMRGIQKSSGGSAGWDEGKHARSDDGKFT